FMKVEGIEGESVDVEHKGGASYYPTIMMRCNRSVILLVQAVVRPLAV
ncbi:hypothetical protein APX70_05802, partial [Pseudomonas syringae pv. maculicola]